MAELFAAHVVQDKSMLSPALYGKDPDVDDVGFVKIAAKLFGRMTCPETDMATSCCWMI